MEMVRRFDVGSARNVVLGIGKVSLVLFVSSPERPAVGSMVGCPQARERLKVERELLRLSGNDGPDTAPPRRSRGYLGEEASSVMRFRQQCSARHTTGSHGNRCHKADPWRRLSEINEPPL